MVLYLVEDSAALAGEQDLFLCALDSGREVDVVCLFQLLTSLCV